MNHVLGAVAAVAPPQSAKQLLETLARIWADKPGGRTRQIQIQSTTALLRWAVAERRLGEDWEPPQDLTVFVGRSRAAKAITTPLEVEPILALVRAIPDARWRFAFQLMAAYGLRPEELQHLQIRQGRPAGWILGHLWKLPRTSAHSSARPLLQAIGRSHRRAAQWNCRGGGAAGA